MPAEQNTPSKRGLIPVWLHVTINMMAMIGGFLGAFFLAAKLIHHLNVAHHGDALAAFAIFAGLSLVSVLIPQLVMAKLIAARCSKCGGRSWANRPGSYDTMKYTCEHCGHVVDTGMNGGGGGD